MYLLDLGINLAFWRIAFTQARHLAVSNRALDCRIKGAPKLHPHTIYGVIDGLIDDIMMST